MLKRTEALRQEAVQGRCSLVEVVAHRLTNHDRSPAQCLPRGLTIAEQRVE